MNVFNDLIDELKADDLLEITQADSGSRNEGNDSESAAVLEELAALEERRDPSNPNSVKLTDKENETGIPDIQKPASKTEFFRKRAMDEVASLQMVEHVISTIERDHLKIIPAAFDDLEVKKALHRFLQVSSFQSPEHAELEYLLLQEAEGWNFAIAERDTHITAGNIRRFCERSRPALSSQALMALARFYRNSPFSEGVRDKFDVVMTRLFSRCFDDETRRLIFTREIMAGHIQTLYSNWSSILLYSAEESNDEIKLAVSKYQAFITEAEQAETFDELLEVDFFKRLRAYKDTAAELFYVPEVCSAAVECNVRVGNKYVDLIFSERAKTKIATVEQKYGYAYDEIISDSVSKTLLLVNLLNAKPSDEGYESGGSSFDDVFPDKPNAQGGNRKADLRSRFAIFGVNKWLLSGAVLLLAVSVGLYFWAESASHAQGGAVIAAEIDLGTSEIKQHIAEARGSDETFYGVVKPTWDALSEEQRSSFLKDVYTFSRTKGYNRVTLLNGRGRTVGFASEEKSEILKP